MILSLLLGWFLYDAPTSPAGVPPGAAVSTSSDDYRSGRAHVAGAEADPSGPAATRRLAHTDAVARFGVAVWNARRERLLTAVRQLEAAARLDPDATAPLRELVPLYARLGREPDAIRVARQVLARCPDDLDVAHELARLLHEAGETAEAVAVARRAVSGSLPIERADKAVALCRNLATLAEQAGELAVSESALLAALDLLTRQRDKILTAAVLSAQEIDAAAAACYERLGKVQTRLGRFAAAAEAFTTAARLYADPKVDDPASARRLQWNLSGVLQAEGQTQAALEALESFLKHRPIATEPYARYAQLLREAGRASDVVPSLRRYRDRDPENLHLQVVLAAELARSPLAVREADLLFRQILDRTKDARIWEVAIRSYLETKRPGEVIAWLDRTFTTLKDKEEDAERKKLLTPELIAARGFAAARARVIADILQADAEAATTVLRAAAADLGAGIKRPHQVHYFLGQLAARHRQLGLAATQLQHAVRNAPRETQGEAYAALLDVLRLAGRPAEVRDVCRDGLRHAADVSPHYFNYYLAGALAELGDAAGALAAIDAAILQTADGDRLTVRLQKVRVLQTLGRLTEAAELSRKLLDEFTRPADRAAIRYALAGVYRAAKRYDEAEAEYRAVLDIDPNHTGACNDYGYHLAELGRDLDEAERLIRHAIAVDRARRRKAGEAETENPGYIDSLGWVLFRKGRLAAARAELERAAALSAATPDPVIWDHLGDVLFRLGDKDKARAAWERASELYDNEPPGAVNRHEGRAAEVRLKLKRLR